MNKTIIAAAFSAYMLCPAAQAQDKPEHELSFNVSASSDYRYRGISQTRLLPALQGGADYVHAPSGFYAGTWLSNIRWTKDAGGDGHVEWDIYGGKRGELMSRLGYDVGVLAYVYPSNGLRHVPGFANANTTEFYGQLSIGMVYLKYSHSMTNLFGFVDSKNSGYLDLGANIPVTEKFTVNLHAGRQRVANSPAASYTDWKAGVSYSFDGGVSASMAIIGTNADKTAYASPVNGKFMGKRSLVASITKSF